MSDSPKQKVGNVRDENPVLLNCDSGFYLCISKLDIICNSFNSLIIWLNSSPVWPNI